MFIVQNWSGFIDCCLYLHSDNESASDNLLSSFSTTEKWVWIGSQIKTHDNGSERERERRERRCCFDELGLTSDWRANDICGLISCRLINGILHKTFALIDIEYRLKGIGYRWTESHMKTDDKGRQQSGESEKALPDEKRASSPTLSHNSKNSYYNCYHV